MYPQEPEPSETTITPGFSFSQKPRQNITSELYKKIKREDTTPRDVFKDEMSLESVFSKLAIISFFLFLVSIGALEMKSLTIASFAGFLMFSAFYGFLRIRNL
jgi:hypothetical protein